MSGTFSRSVNRFQSNENPVELPVSGFLVLCSASGVVALAGWMDGWMDGGRPPSLCEGKLTLVESRPNEINEDQWRVALGARWIPASRTPLRCVAARQGSKSHTPAAWW
ncbi:hypothetical protein K0M31_000394 [Melipona bicolor]|uniref:Uncharacterized protein n=1 Tax=Melipona bicolor TaxID=60889 RepID=A0AA40GDF1_9HYME|nr:hypothetical protein K0M31_000394 [Melipona bicolor]